VVVFLGIVPILFLRMKKKSVAKVTAVE
jgi:hypothetical protein